MDGGSLSLFLRENGDDLENNKLFGLYVKRFEILLERPFLIFFENNSCCDTTYGMEYLHSQNIIHKDLATRNLLVKRNHESNIVKVADFVRFSNFVWYF